MYTYIHTYIIYIRTYLYKKSKPKPFNNNVHNMNYEIYSIITMRHYYHSHEMYHQQNPEVHM